MRRNASLIVFLLFLMGVAVLAQNFPPPQKAYVDTVGGDLSRSGNTVSLTHSNSPSVTWTNVAPGVWQAIALAGVGTTFNNTPSVTWSNISAGLWQATAAPQTNGLIGSVTGPGLSTTGGAVTFSTNGWGLLDKTLTNGLAGLTITNGLALLSVTNGLPTIAVTNALVGSVTGPGLSTSGGAVTFSTNGWSLGTSVDMSWTNDALTIATSTLGGLQFGFKNGLLTNMTYSPLLYSGGGTGLFWDGATNGWSFGGGITLTDVTNHFTTAAQSTIVSNLAAAASNAVATAQSTANGAQGTNLTQDAHILALEGQTNTIQSTASSLNSTSAYLNAQIASKAATNNTVTVNGSTQKLGDNPSFTVTTGGTAPTTNTLWRQTISSGWAMDQAGSISGSNNAAILVYNSRTSGISTGRVGRTTSQPVLQSNYALNIISYPSGMRGWGGGTAFRFWAYQTSTGSGTNSQAHRFTKYDGSVQFTTNITVTVSNLLQEVDCPTNLFGVFNASDYWIWEPDFRECCGSSNLVSDLAQWYALEILP